MKDLKVGLLGNVAYQNLHYYTGGEAVKDISTAMKQDILIFTGGGDICPVLYDEEDRFCAGIDIARDLFEKNVLIHATALGIKILGICRGHQLINAVLGGKLIQDIFSETGNLHWNSSKMKNGFGVWKRIHDFTPEEESFWSYESLAHLFPVVNTYHHQAVLIPGKGLDVILNSRDGIIEATCSKDHNIVTFQFHPEWDHVGDRYFKRMMETGQLIW
jgi:putative glutamine amidotransferase